jgi:hypothetical protein
MAQLDFYEEMAGKLGRAAAKTHQTMAQKVDAAIAQMQADSGRRIADLEARVASLDGQKVRVPRSAASRKAKANV